MEVLGGGREREPRLKHGPFVGMSRYRRLVTGLALVVVAGTVWVAYAVTAPRIPSVLVASLLGNQAGGGEVNAPWQAASDGRPTSGVEVQVTAVVAAPHRSSDRLTVLGMQGPGVLDTRSRPIVVPAQSQTLAVLVADLDCSRVLFPVMAADYRIRMQLVAGSRTTTGSVAVGGISALWASSVAQACGSWLARRDLTVVQATASVDPAQPSADLAIMIDNKGVRAAYIGLGWNYGALNVSARSAAEMVLAPGKTSTVHVHVAIRSCDSVPPPFAALGGDITTSTDYLGIAALVGSRPQAPHADGNLPPLSGTVPTGIVIAPGPQTAIAQALRSACADLDQFVTLIADHGISLDPKTGVMTVRINIDGTPGRVRDVLLISDPPPADNTAYVPLWTAIPGLVPDPSGQVTALLRYGLPTKGASACPSQGAWIPGFTLIAEVPAGGTIKTLRYSQYIDPSQDPLAIKALCPAGTPLS